MVKEQRNAILFSNVDREDYWVSGGLCFRVNDTETSEGAYNEVKHKLESPEMIEHLIEDRSLLFDLFEEDETYKFKKTDWANALYFVFENDNGDEVEHRMSADFIYLVD